MSDATTNPEPALEELVRQAVAGDRLAVVGVVRGIERDVYGLALRMLWRREDAEDATQEILVRIVTRLAQYDFRSRLKTWVYRVAANYLLDVKKSCVERQHLTFTSFAEDLGNGLSLDGPQEGERSMLVEEVKIGCSLAMLQCLDRPHRLAYVLGEILELSAPEAAEALSLEAATFRKRLQRARDAVEAFTRAHCGLVADAAACRCNRRVQGALRLGRVQVDAIAHAQSATSFVEARALTRRVEKAKWALEVHRASHPAHSTIDFARQVISALEPAPL